MKIPTDVLCPFELSQTPMEDCHKLLTRQHYTRLLNILAHPTDLPIGTYTSKQAAREQIARMTLIIRDYIELATIYRESGLEDHNENIESMIIDVVEAARTVYGLAKPWHQSLFLHGRLWGREQEIANIMQEQSAAEHVEDVLELWKMPRPNMHEAKEKPLPDIMEFGGEDFGKDVDWKFVLLRSRSEGNILHDLRNFEIENQEEWELEIFGGRGSEEAFGLLWPPPPPPVVEDPKPKPHDVDNRQQRGRAVTGLDSVQPQPFLSTSRVRGRSRAQKWRLSEAPNHEILRLVFHGVAELAGAGGETRRSIEDGGSQG